MYKVILALLLAGCVSNVAVNNEKETSSLEKNTEVIKNEKQEVKSTYKSYNECKKLDLAKSYKKSFSCYMEISKNNDEMGYFGLAKSYHYGNGVKKDLEKSVLNYEKAANLGNVDASLMLGSIYERGLLGEVDYEKAFYWYEKAGLNNNSKAAFALSYLYANGKGIQKDDIKSKYWLEKSAENGFSYAQYLLGKSYYNRYLLTKNNEFLEKSKDLLLKASMQGDASAGELLKAVESLLN